MIEKVIAEKSRQHSERVIELISEHREFTATRLAKQIDSYSPCRMVGDMFLSQIQRLKNNIVKVTPYLIRKSIIHCYHSLLKFNGHLNLFLRYWYGMAEALWIVVAWTGIFREYDRPTFSHVAVVYNVAIEGKVPSRNTTLSSLIKCRNCTERPLNVLSAKRKYFGSSTMPAIVLMSDWPSICSLSAIIWEESIS